MCYIDVNLIQCIHVSFVVKDLIKEEEKLVPSDRIVIGTLWNLTMSVVLFLYGTPNHMLQQLKCCITRRILSRRSTIDVYSSNVGETVGRTACSQFMATTTQKFSTGNEVAFRHSCVTMSWYSTILQMFWAFYRK